ncbi:MAG: DUF2207 domain-containing protein [Synergistetes bacterium]|nr:DUF2207 domain-containing protein [Synergistota bacterium]
MKRQKEVLQRYRSKILLTALVAILPFFLFSPIAHAKSYYIKDALIAFDISHNGKIKVREEITYSLSGKFHYLKRIIPLRGLHVENVQVSVKGAAAKIQREIFQGRGVRIIAYISDDPNNIYSGVLNKDVTLITSYELSGAVKLFKDIAEFFPKFWGEGWPKPVKTLIAQVSFPAKELEITYWVHPKDFLKSVKMSEGKIILRFENIPPHQFIEARFIVPKTLFDKNAKFAKKFGYPALAKIKDIERTYKIRELLIRYFSILILVSAFLIPLFIYFKWGREPKVSYHAPYEHEPPYPEPPSFVNAIMMGKIGVPTLEGFVASVLELIRKGFIKMETRGKNDIIIKLNDVSSKGKLNRPEEEILKFLREYLNKGERSWKELTKIWKGSASFREFFDEWKGIVSWELKPERFFTDTGSRLMKAYGIIALMAGIISIVMILFGVNRMFHPTAWNLMIVCLGGLSLSGLISLLLPEQVGGRWTSFGRSYYMKWKAFKRFLSDFSLLKLHPPSSIAIWDKYLVYATALGVAEKTWKAMKVLVPKTVATESSFYPMWGFYPFWIGSFYHPLREAYAYKPEGGGEDIFSGFIGGDGGIGGIGGGFGGGGGEAG